MVTVVVMAAAGIDPHMEAGTNLAGLLLGVLGSLFFTYDLIGRPGGPLRWLLRVTLPLLLSTAVVVLAVAILIQVEPSGAGSASLLALSLAAALFGALPGLFNGLFVGEPTEGSRRRLAFSLRDGGAGFVVGFVCVGVADWIGRPVQAELARAVAAGVIGAVLGAFWRGLNRIQVQPGKRPPLVSLVGLIIGLVSGGALLLIVVLAIFFGAHQSTTDFVGLWLVPALMFGGAAGAVTGGVSRFTFWWANSLPPRGLEIIGILLILAAFVAQAITPVLVLFNAGVQ
jgi:hypothetical protein